MSTIAKIEERENVLRSLILKGEEISFYHPYKYGSNIETDSDTYCIPVRNKGYKLQEEAENIVFRNGDFFHVLERVCGEMKERGLHFQKPKVFVAMNGTKKRVSLN